MIRTYVDIGFYAIANSWIILSLKAQRATRPRMRANEHIFYFQSYLACRLRVHLAMCNNCCCCAFFLYWIIEVRDNKRGMK